MKPRAGHVPLSDEMRAAVEAGEYESPGAVVQAAVETWWADRVTERIGVARLRQHLRRAAASGDSQRLNVVDVLDRARRRADETREARRSA